jgi:hypothetical protein
MYCKLKRQISWPFLEIDTRIERYLQSEFCMQIGVS